MQAVIYSTQLCWISVLNLFDSFFLTGSFLIWHLCHIQLQLCINSDPFEDINQMAESGLFELSVFRMSPSLAPSSINHQQQGADERTACTMHRGLKAPVIGCVASGRKIGQTHRPSAIKPLKWAVKRMLRGKTAGRTDRVSDKHEGNIHKGHCTSVVICRDKSTPVHTDAIFRPLSKITSARSDPSHLAL